MDTLLRAALAALLAASVVASAQAPPPSSPDPNAASSPHQREATGTGTAESPTTDGAQPGAASSPHQREAMNSGSEAESEAAMQRPESAGSFVMKAAQDGMTEVELGKLAMSKSNSSEVKTFAQRMVQDHGKANTELAGIAKKQGLAVPQKLDSQHQGMVTNLSSKSGAAFDSAYAAHMARDHSKAVALFQAESKSSDAELAAFAKKTLPTLQEHKQMADSLQASVGPATARTPR